MNKYEYSHIRASVTSLKEKQAKFLLSDDYSKKQYDKYQQAIELLEATIMQKTSGIMESNHWKHFLGGIGVAYVAGIDASVVAAACLEFKDNAWGGEWDWKDFWWTVAGGTIGEALRIVTICLVFPNFFKVLVSAIQFYI